MTPEAKQAAADEIEDWLQHRDDPLSEPRQSGRFVQQAIDAATAKWQGELNESAGVVLQGMVEVQRLRNLETKLREELEIKDELLNKIAGRTGTKTKGIK
jgi:hypothetical protein